MHYLLKFPLCRLCFSQTEASYRGTVVAFVLKQVVVGSKPASSVVVVDRESALVATCRLKIVSNRKIKAETFSRRLHWRDRLMKLELGN